MNKYYECRITFFGKPEIIQPIVERAKWKFSAIDGDPVLGDGIKCYATKHFSFKKLGESEVVKNVRDQAKCFGLQGLEVLRDKVELVVYDSKTFKLDNN